MIYQISLAKPFPVFPDRQGMFVRNIRINFSSACRLVYEKAAGLSHSNCVREISYSPSPIAAGTVERFLLCSLNIHVKASRLLSSFRYHAGKKAASCFAFSPHFLAKHRFFCPESRPENLVLLLAGAVKKFRSCFFAVRKADRVPGKGRLIFQAKGN